MAQVRIDISGWDFNEISNKFANVRESLSNEIIEHINRLSDIHEFLECGTYFHTKRQLILEDIHTYMDTVLLLENEADVRKSAVLSSVISNPTDSFAYKSKDEKLLLVNGDTQVARLNQFINLFKNQILFLDETKKTVEGVIYHMKDRLTIQKELG